MEDRKKFVKKILIILIIVILIILIFSITKKGKNTNVITEDSLIDIDKSNNTNDQELIQEYVNGYHLVTYNQTANLNSFVQSIEVVAENEGNIRFVIGSIDENDFIKERTEFYLECQKGENKFELLDSRYLVKEGEYLFMDLFGQDFVYSQKDSATRSLIQAENKKINGKMRVQDSNYILPFKYSLEKITDYNVLVLGNEITIGNDNIGLGATEAKLDYYNLTKNRLLDTFENINMSRIDISKWEKNENSSDKLLWIEENIRSNDLQNNDLIILQIGDNFVGENFEDDFSELIDYLRKYSPNAQIIYMGMWSYKEDIFKSLPRICEKEKIYFINISDLNTEDYKTPVQINSDEGNTEVYYPNNEAMQIISNRIIEKLDYKIY